MRGANRKDAMNEFKKAEGPRVSPGFLHARGLVIPTGVEVVCQA